VNSPSRVWVRAPAEILFGVFKPYNLTSGGNNCNFFLENQQIKKYEHFIMVTERHRQVVERQFQVMERQTQVAERCSG